MMDAVQNDRTPNFLFLHYQPDTWSIENLLLVPHFAFPTSAIIKRKPLSLTARRAGWVGCLLALDRIPSDARIHVVKNRAVAPAEDVREQFRRVKPLNEISVKERGWTLDVLNAVRSLRKTEFTNDDAYTLVSQLEKLHPGNRHIKDKIRQQLQNMRDAGLLIHLERGRWCLK